MRSCDHRSQQVFSLLVVHSTLGTKSQIKENIITPSINEVVKSVFSNFTAEDLVKKRADVSKDIFKKLENKTAAYGITLIDVNIVNFKFSDSFNNAIESKVRAEQEALTEKNKLEKTKYMAQQKNWRSKRWSWKNQNQCWGYTKTRLKRIYSTSIHSKMGW